MISLLLGVILSVTITPKTIAKIESTEVVSETTERLVINNHKRRAAKVTLHCGLDYENLTITVPPGRTTIDISAPEGFGLINCFILEAK